MTSSRTALSAARFVTSLVAAITLFSAAKAAVPPPVEAVHGMVVTSQRLASEVGAQILKQGGNAVDAAVAVGYAEAVVNPCCGNIGGGGFMVLRMADGRRRFINFRETAPAAATANMYLDTAGNPIPEASRFGYKAVAVPGTVMGLERALKEFGTLPRTAVMAPAIALARDGFILTDADVDALQFGGDRFAKDPEAARIFLKPDGTMHAAGDRLVQTDLAETLVRISRDGPDAFYKGVIPEAVAKASASHGGLLTAADFAAYTTTEADPVVCHYRGSEILSAPPPSSGGITLCETLAILEGYDLKAAGFHSAQSVHLLTEALRNAYLDRNSYLGDPAFVTNPTALLISPEYAARIRAKILPDHATPSSDLKIGTPPHEKAETTHYSVVDAAGNAVAVTYTINGGFGAVVVAPGTGFLLNDEMDDFSIKPGVENMFRLVQGKPDIIAPGKRPLSSMTPTIVLKDGKPFLIVGSPGGSRIISAVLQTIINVIDYGMNPQEAVDAPRLHHQYLPDELYAEPYAIAPDTAKLLDGMGYKIVQQRGWGAVELIEIAPNDTAAKSGPAGIDAILLGRLKPGRLYGANDDRRPGGAAIGY